MCIRDRPILVQIPVFFALYKVLFVTIEMRQMPFFGWIQDLSERDPTSLFNLFGLLPYDVPSFLMIGAWPIAMGISMWAQQKLNPAPTDPMQAKIFAIIAITICIRLAFFPLANFSFRSMAKMKALQPEMVRLKELHKDCLLYTSPSPRDS